MKTKTSKSILLVIGIILSMACSIFQSSQQSNAPSVTSVKLTDFDPNSYIEIGLGRVYNLKYSPDSKTLAVATSTGVLFYDTTTYDLLKHFPDGFVDNLAWSPDGSKLAYSSGEDIKLIDLESERITALEEKGLWLVGKEMSWSPDGKMLASIESTHNDGAVYVWDTTSGKLIQRIIYPEKRAFGRYINACGVAWSPDGKYLVVPYGSTNISAADKPSDIVIWNISNQTATAYKQWVIADMIMEGIEWTPDGKYLILGGNPLTIFDAEDGLVVNKTDTPNSSRFAISSDGNHLLIPSGMATNNLPDGSKSVSVSGKTEVSPMTYSIPDLIKTYEFKGRIYSPETVDISSNGKFVIAGDSFIDGFEVWDYQSQEIIKSISLESNWNVHVKFSPDSKYFATLGQDTLIRLYSTENGKLIQTFEEDITNMPNELSWTKTNGIIKMPLFYRPMENGKLQLQT